MQCILGVVMPRYTAGPAQIAYDVVGAGDLTLVVIPGLIQHLPLSALRGKVGPVLSGAEGKGA